MNQLINEQRERISHLERINDGLTSVIEKMELVAKELGYDNSMTCSELEYLVETALAVAMVNQKNFELIAERDTLKQQNAELAAYVEFFTSAISERFTSKESQPDGTIITDGAPWALTLLRETPAQCLLEVRPEAVERAIELYTHKLGTDEKLNNVGFDIIRRFGEYIHPGGLRDYVQQLRSGDCDQYANKIRGGE